MAGNSGILLTGLRIDSLAPRHLPWALEEGQQLRMCPRHTGRDSCVASRRRKPPLSLYWGSLLSCGWWADTVFPVLRPPHRPNLNFHWPGKSHLFHPGTLPLPFHAPPEAVSAACGQLVLARTAVFLGELSGVCRPQSRMVSLSVL